MNQTENKGISLTADEQLLINQLVLSQPQYANLKKDADMITMGYIQGRQSASLISSPTSIDERLNLNSEFNKVVGLYNERENYTEEIELPSFLLSNISKALNKISTAVKKDGEEDFNLEVAIAKELESFSKDVLRTIKYTVTAQETN